MIKITQSIQTTELIFEQVWVGNFVARQREGQMVLPPMKNI